MQKLGGDSSTRHGNGLERDNGLEATPVQLWKSGARDGFRVDIARALGFSWAFRKNVMFLGEIFKHLILFFSSHQNNNDK